MLRRSARFAAAALLSASAPVFAAAPLVSTPGKVVCVGKPPAEFNLMDLAWTGSRYAATWYERRVLTTAPRKEAPPPVDTTPPPPGPAPVKPGRVVRQPFGPLQPPVAPPPPICFEQKLGFLTPALTLEGDRRDVRPSDNTSFVTGQLAFTGQELGLAFADDRSGQRTTFFRKFDRDGAPRGDAFAVSKEALPHNDAPSLAWNAATESWGVLFAGTFGVGNITNHVFLSRFRGSEPGPALRLDEDESSGLLGSNAGLVADGSCFVASWVGYPAKAAVMAEVCGDTVHRLAVPSPPAIQPMQASVAGGNGRYLMAWVDRIGVEVRDGADLYLALVERTPKALVLKGRLHLDQKGYAQSPHVAFDGRTFWVTWSEGPQVWLAHLDFDGKRLEADRTIGGPWTEPTWSRLVFNGRSLVLLISAPNHTGCVEAVSEVAAARGP